MTKIKAPVYVKVDGWMFDHRWYWVWNHIWFPVTRPRVWLCDQGIWHCTLHPRTAHSRLAFRKRRRAKRIKSYQGWTPAEMDAILARKEVVK